MACFSRRAASVVRISTLERPGLAISEADSVADGSCAAGVKKSAQCFLLSSQAGGGGGTSSITPRLGGGGKTTDKWRARSRWAPSPDGGITATTRSLAGERPAGDSDQLNMLRRRFFCVSIPQRLIATT